MLYDRARFGPCRAKTVGLPSFFRPGRPLAPEGRSLWIAFIHSLWHLVTGHPAYIQPDPTEM